MNKKVWRTSAAIAVLTIPLVAVSLEIAKDDPSVGNAEIKPKAQHSLLLDVAVSEAGFVAVGERGHILISKDGTDWQQSDVPTRSTLTSVSTQGASIWAAGHDGVIVHSADGGKTWQRQRVQPWSPESQEITNGSAILDTLFTDATTGYAVGAYSLLLKTQDGGATWQPLAISGSSAPDVQADMVASDTGVFSDSDLALAAESDPHLNTIVRTDSGALIVLGERGAGFKSVDGGQSWQKLRLPYAGSMFGLLSLGGERVIAFGLRGNVLESFDGGNSWSNVDSGTDTSLIGGTVTDDGRIVLVGGNGTLVVRSPGQAAFSARSIQNKNGQNPAFTAAVPTQNGVLLTSDLGAVNTTVQ